MGALGLSLLLMGGAASDSPDTLRGGSYLCQSAFVLDSQVRTPTEPCTLQPGDIFLATDQELWARVGHWLAGGAGVHHSGIIFRRSSGELGLLEAGPFNSVKVEILDPCAHMHDHVAAGDVVWIRRRCVPLTAEQSVCLTAFAEAQEGKAFASWRMLAQITPLRGRTPLRIYFCGAAHGNRAKYFCSELVMECCVAAGLHDPETARPKCTYPRDLFFGKSSNWYLDRHLDLNEGWSPPARWLEWPCR
jgi:hypothetical protein